MKTMLITGAAHGLGAAIAQAADAAGYRTGVLDLTLEECAVVADGLANGIAVAADVCDAVSVERALDTLGDAPAVLVNNAGILRTGPLIDHSPEDFRRVMDVNLNGVFIVAQAAARRMRGSGGGVIINMSSINGIHPSPNCGAYVAAKAGVIGLTQQMSIEWGEYGIRVNAVAPGPIWTPLIPASFDADQVATFGQDTPMGRAGQPEEVAPAYVYLASDDAAYVTGQTLHVNGGTVVGA